jgi:hypothetical protein
MVIAWAAEKYNISALWGKHKNLPVWNVLVSLKISILLCKTKIDGIYLYYMIPQNAYVKQKQAGTYNNKLKISSPSL